MACKPISEEMFEKVIALVREGRSVSSACNVLGIPRDGLYSLLDQKPHLLERQQRARRDGTFAIGDEILEISDTDPDVNRAKVRIDARKFYVSKINPEVFGERVDINVQAAPSMDRILAKIDALLLPNSDPSNVIDAEVIETKQLSDNRATGSKPDDAKDAAKIEAIESNLGAKKPNDSSN